MDSVAVIGELTLGVVLVKLLDQSVDLGDRAFCLVQLPALFRKLLLLVLAIANHLLPCELLLEDMFDLHKY